MSVISASACSAGGDSRAVGGGVSPFRAGPRVFRSEGEASFALSDVLVRESPQSLSVCAPGPVSGFLSGELETSCLRFVNFPARWYKFPSLVDEVICEYDTLFSFRLNDRHHASASIKRHWLRRLEALVCP